jgi:hypothetical protein
MTPRKENPASFYFPLLHPQVSEVTHGAPDGNILKAADGAPDREYLASSAIHRYSQRQMAPHMRIA